MESVLSLADFSLRNPKLIQYNISSVISDDRAINSNEGGGRQPDHVQRLLLLGKHLKVVSLHEYFGADHQSLDIGGGVQYVDVLKGVDLHCLATSGGLLYNGGGFTVWISSLVGG